jgi:cytochrome b6-f complex iron-sulfur subunit
VVASAKRNPNVVAKPSRREFLNYALGASVLLAGASTCAGLAWFTQQQISFKEGSGYFQIALYTLPETGEAPVKAKDAWAWLVSEAGLLFSLSSTCTYRGCFVRWSNYNHRFECPCCGSKFQLDGTYIEGPARRSLDRCELRITTHAKTIITPDDGAGLPFADATSIILNTNRLIYGAPRELNPDWVRRNPPNAS